MTLSRTGELKRKAPMKRGTGPRSRPKKKTANQKRKASMKTLRNKADTVFSLLVREAWNYTCAKTGMTEGRMECSHIFSRRHARTRWDTDNAKCLCHAAHRWWHENPVESGVWAREFFGHGYIELLDEKRNSIFRWTATELEALIAHMEEERARIAKLRDEGVQGYIRPIPYD